MSDKKENKILNLFDEACAMAGNKVEQALFEKGEIKDRLKTLRSKAGFSQEQIAQRIGVNRVTYSGYENGRSEPCIALLIKIADVYNVSLDYLCGRCNSEKGLYTSATKNELDAMEARLQEMFDRVRELIKKHGE